MKKTMIICDFCGLSKLEGTSSSWFTTLITVNNRFIIYKDSKSLDDSEDICSRECLHKVIENWLNDN